MPPKRTKISPALRTSVWNVWNGSDNAKALCWCCGTEECSRGNFDCGHVVAIAKDGTTDVDNLRPVCGSCNSSMGTKNMQEFAAENKLRGKIIEQQRKEQEAKNSREEEIKQLREQFEQKERQIREAHAAEIKMLREQGPNKSSEYEIKSLKEQYQAQSEFVKSQRVTISQLETTLKAREDKIKLLESEVERYKQKQSQVGVSGLPSLPQLPRTVNNFPRLPILPTLIWDEKLGTNIHLYPDSAGKPYRQAKPGEHICQDPKCTIPFLQPASSFREGTYQCLTCYERVKSGSRS